MPARPILLTASPALGASLTETIAAGKRAAVDACGIRQDGRHRLSGGREIDHWETGSVRIRDVR
jgi:hypothetical protein